MQRKNVFSQNACVHTEQVAGMMANVGLAARRRRLSFPQQQMSPPLSIGLHSLLTFIFAKSVESSCLCHKCR